MAEATKFYRNSRQLSLFCVLLLIALGAGCTHPHAAAPATPPPLAQTQPSSSQKATPPPDEQAGEASEEAQSTQNKISPQQAEELFRSVDNILKFASTDTGLPIKQEVKKRLTSRDEVEKYLEKNMAEDKDAQRLRRSELVLKKFGLLPHDFDLQGFLVALLKEQVAGYYDPKTKTVNLLDWLDIEQQKPVMAHELTHALQDQSFGLEKWMKAGDKDMADIKQPTAEDFENDETSTARQAVVEGQAMAVLVDYMLAPVGQSLTSSPQIVEALKQGMLVGTADSIQFRNAPLYLKEAMTFPYRYGLDFTAALLVAGGKDKAYRDPFARPPRTTREIMEPATYLAGEKLDPMRLPDFQHVFHTYERFDIGSVGEFDVAVIVDQFAGSDASHALYPHWRGGYYYAAKPKGDPAAPLGLLFASRWSSPRHAAEFAAAYAQSLNKRYKHVHETGEGSLPDLSALQSLGGKHVWLTEEGTVEIDTQGDTVLVMESLDQPTMDLLEQQVLPAAK